MLRGVRGATTAEDNTEESITSATVELLRELIKVNSIELENVGAIIFSATPDLDASFAASAARHGLGLEELPLFGCQEIDVAAAPEKCIRILILLNTDRQQNELQSVYLHNAVDLRSCG